MCRRVESVRVIQVTELRQAKSLVPKRFYLTPRKGPWYQGEVRRLLGRIIEALEAAQGVVIAMRKKTWNRYTGIGLLSAATALAVVSTTPAGADDVQATSIPVPAGEREAQEGKPEAPDPSSWDAQRRIPVMSPFVEGTGFWGPSNKPGYD